MKKRTLLFTFALLTMLISACNSEPKGRSNTDSVTYRISDFLDDFSALEKVEVGNPITIFKELAEEDATKIIELKKGNMEELLLTAKDYKHCIITLENHTIVKVLDYEDCTPSGSWGTCMPMVEGYVKKGGLISKKDYLNNIIGTPDSQERQAFLFN